MENYKVWLSTEDSALWEHAYLDYVTHGIVSIDEYVIDWIGERIKIPESQDYSIFAANVILDAVLLNIQVQIGTQYQGRNRFVYMMLWTSGSLHPSFEYIHEPDEANSRFESIGNPSIDTHNYRIWEEYLFMKLSSEILFEKGGLDAIIEAIHRHR